MLCIALNIVPSLRNPISISWNVLEVNKNRFGLFVLEINPPDLGYQGPSRSAARQTNSLINLVCCLVPASLGTCF